MFNREMEEFEGFLREQYIDSDEINNLLLLRAENITLDSCSDVQLSLGLGSSAKGFAYFQAGEEGTVHDF